MDLKEKIVNLSQGNPGAVNVLLRLSTLDDGERIIDRLEELKLRGPGIWIAYKDYSCREDLGVFASKVLDDYTAAQLVETAKAQGYYDYRIWPVKTP